MVAICILHAQLYTCLVANWASLQKETKECPEKRVFSLSCREEVFNFKATLMPISSQFRETKAFIQTELNTEINMYKLLY